MLDRNHGLELEEETRVVGATAFVATEDASDSGADATSVSGESSENNAQEQYAGGASHPGRPRRRGHSDRQELVQSASTRQLRRSSRKRRRPSPIAEAEALHPDSSTESEEDSIKHYNPRESTPTATELRRRDPIGSQMSYNRRKAKKMRMPREQESPHSTQRRPRKHLLLEDVNDSDGSVVSCAPNSHLKRPRNPSILLDEDDEPENQPRITPQATPLVAHRHIPGDHTPKTQNIPTVLKVDAENTSPAMAAQEPNKREHAPSVGKSRRLAAEPVSEVMNRVTMPGSAPDQAVLTARKRKRAEIELEYQALEVQQKKIALNKRLLELEDE